MEASVAKVAFARCRCRSPASMARWFSCQLGLLRYGFHFVEGADLCVCVCVCVCFFFAGGGWGFGFWGLIEFFFFFWGGGGGCFDFVWPFSLRFLGTLIFLSLLEAEGLFKP